MDDPLAGRFFAKAFSSPQCSSSYLEVRIRLRHSTNNEADMWFSLAWVGVFSSRARRSSRLTDTIFRLLPARFWLFRKAACSAGVLTFAQSWVAFFLTSILRCTMRENFCFLVRRPPIGKKKSKKKTVKSDAPSKTVRSRSSHTVLLFDWKFNYSHTEIISASLNLFEKRYAHIQG